MKINVPAGHCKNESCKQVFPITRRGKVYCCKVCKNTQWVREKRRQKKIDSIKNKE